MKRTSFIAAAFVLAASGARAQQTAQQPVPPSPSVPLVTEVPPGPSMPREKLQRIYHIRQIESMLTNAVKAGAASLANQLKLGEPNSLFVTGSARTRGFELEGYGVFFDVDVPTMMQSVVWSSQLLQQQQYLDLLQRRLSDPTLDADTRRMATYEMRRVQRAIAGGQVAPIPALPGQLGVAPPAAQGMAVAQTTDAPAAPATSAPMGSPMSAPDPRTPDELYTEAIKGALIDAMLSYGSALHLADSEWLTIAARATGQASPGALDDASSIVLRIKGSDLTAFIAGKISRDEAIKRIETKES